MEYCPEDADSRSFTETFPNWASEPIPARWEHFALQELTGDAFTSILPETLGPKTSKTKNEVVLEMDEYGVPVLPPISGTNSTLHMQSLARTYMTAHYREYFLISTSP